MFLGLFAAAQSTFEQAVTGTPGRRDFVTMDRPIELQDLADHLAGRRAIAVRPRLPDGTCTLGVIDIDAVDGPVVSALAYAKALQTVASAWGWVTLLEETGGRGAHVWFPVRGRLGSALMSDYLARLVAAAGVPAGFVRVEVLPGPDDAPELHASLMTLPLGVHVESGARSRLEWNDGVPVGLDLSGIGHGEAIPPERLSEAPLEAPLTSSVSSVKPKGPPPMLAQGGETGSKVAAVMKGCAVLRHLADKAAATGHLDHAERLSVLYTLGHLGEPGQRAIHTIIRKCSNYDERETERHISRLSGLPIGCTRMRDKHVTPELEAHCRCPFDEVRKRGGYPTPLLHAIPFKRHWRDILRERDRPAEPPEGSEQGVRVLPASPLPAPAEIEHCTAAGLPPHEWAAPSRGRR